MIRNPVAQGEMPPLVQAVIGHLRDGQVAVADMLCRQALAKRADDTDALFGLSLVAHKAGRVDDAIELLRRAIAADGRQPALCMHLARLLHAAGRTAEAVPEYRRVVALRPRNVEAGFGLAAALAQGGDLSGAVAVYRQLTAARPDHAEAWQRLGLTLNRLDRSDEAIDALRRAVALDGRFAGDTVRGNLLLRTGRAADAVAAFDACLALNPRNRRALAHKAAALRELGDADAAGRLVDFDRFLRSVRLAPPPGYGALAEFNAALAAHALAHPTLAYEPLDSATRQGSQTRQLAGEAGGAMAAFEAAIRVAVADYLTGLGRDPTHPFLAQLPARWTLSIWATVLDSQGHQLPHIHPAAAVGGVYYVRVPPAVAAGDGQQGWIEFGRPSERLNCRAEPAVRAIRPEEGLLLLFPSYFFHRTIPFQADEKRISLAFDVIAED